MKDDPVATNDRTSSAEAEAEARTSAKDGAKSGKDMAKESAKDGANETSRPRRPGDLEGKDHAIGLGIAAVYVGWLLATARTLGFCRDEGFYFNASSRYAQWFRVLFERPGDAMKRPFIDSLWSANHEHPSLMKSLFGLSYKYDIFYVAGQFAVYGLVLLHVAAVVWHVAIRRDGTLERMLPEQRL